MPSTVFRSLLASAVATATTDTPSSSAQVGHSRFHSFYIYWTPASASSTTLTVKIQTSDAEDNITDANATWVQDQVWTLSGGHYTTAVTDLQSATSSASQVLMRYDFTVCAKRIRVLHNSTIANGTLTVELLSKER